MILSLMNLPGAGYPKEILNKSYRDWTPEEAELVRRHFLGPLLHDMRYSWKPLGAVAWDISCMRNLVDKDEEKLMYLAMSYSDYVERTNNSFTRSPRVPMLVEQIKEPETEVAAANSPATSAATQNS